MKTRLDLDHSLALNRASTRRQVIGDIAIGLIGLAMLWINTAAPVSLASLKGCMRRPL